jgi:hypothetical protein
MKQLTITLTLPLELDYFGLHTIPDGTREWLGLMRTGAEEHGCTVAMEVEDVRGLRKAPGRAKGGNARAAKLSPERRSEIAKQAADTRWNGSGDAVNMVPNDAA